LIKRTTLSKRLKWKIKQLTLSKPQSINLKTFLTSMWKMSSVVKSKVHSNGSFSSLDLIIKPKKLDKWFKNQKTMVSTWTLSLFWSTVKRKGSFRTSTQKKRMETQWEIIIRTTTKIKLSLIHTPRIWSSFARVLLKVIFYKLITKFLTIQKIILTILTDRQQLELVLLQLLQEKDDRCKSSVGNRNLIRDLRNRTKSTKSPRR